MTKEEFKGFSSAAQHDMVLEALVRITKNLETMEKESGNHSRVLPNSVGMISSCLLFWRKHLVKMNSSGIMLEYIRIVME